MTDQEIVINLREEIEKYAAPASHTHSAYAPTNSVTTSGTKAVKSSGIVTYVTQQINNKIQDFQNNTLPNIINTNIGNSITENITSTLTDYLTKSEAQSTYATKEEIPEITDANIYANPKTTTNKINKIIDPGYYQYIGTDATFFCQPDNIHYTNGIIKVEREDNYITQYVYSTSYLASAQKYKIDGRKFVRNGIISNNNATWDEWRVVHIPWKKRNDLLKIKGTNVSDNGFSIYECTAGYVFQWKQDGEQQKYTLPMAQYDYGSIYTFTDIPIVTPYIFSNLIGRIDIKITENDFRIRSTSKKNEDIVGVNGTYFVPRIN